VPSAVLDPRIGRFVDNLPPLSSVFLYHIIFHVYKPRLHLNRFSYLLTYLLTQRLAIHASSREVHARMRGPIAVYFV